MCYFTTVTDTVVEDGIRVVFKCTADTAACACIGQQVVGISEQNYRCATDFGRVSVLSILYRLMIQC